MKLNTAAKEYLIEIEGTEVYSENDSELAVLCPESGCSRGFYIYLQSVTSKAYKAFLKICNQKDALASGQSVFCGKNRLTQAD